MANDIWDFGYHSLSSVLQIRFVGFGNFQIFHHKLKCYSYTNTHIGSCGLQDAYSKDLLGTEVRQLSPGILEMNLVESGLVQRFDEERIFNCNHVRRTAYHAATWVSDRLYM